mmetsp:Transcript_23399/g.40935  ORF Transcript_23399/g.40935 Transcript_23399/m.40935 type:complete len:271 (+) Transcript_23399:3463-4275(+)
MVVSAGCQIKVEPVRGPDLVLDFKGHALVFLQERFGVLATLADPLVTVAEPGAGFFNHAGLDTQIQQLAHLRDAFAIHDVKLNLFEGRRHLVLDHFDARGVAHHFVAILERSDAADIQTDGGIEFERVAPRRCFGRAEHDADFHPDLVDKDNHAIRTADRACQFAHRLAHQTGLDTDVAIAHVAFQLGFWRKGGNRIDNHHVDRTGAHERVCNLKRLLAIVRLGDQQFIDVDAQFFCILRVKRMLGIHKGTDAAGFLLLCHAMQREGGLA